MVTRQAALALAPDGTLSHRLRLDQAQAIRPDRLCAALVRGAPVVWGQLLDGIAVTRLGRGGQTPALPIFHHAASACGPRHPPGRVPHCPGLRAYTARKIGAHTPLGKRQEQTKRREDR